MALLKTTGALARSCHPGPTLAVTVLAGLLAQAFDASLVVGVVVVVAVMSGQLVIGWSNDLIDAERDRADGRSDKPLAGGAVARGMVLGALAVSGLITVASSLWLGLIPGLIHLVLLVGSGVVYNAGVKATVWSFVPYALAFGALPAVVWLAASGSSDSAGTHGAPPGWVMIVGALLGMGAHLLNVLPDLVDDERHGIRGLPHRLGRRRTQLLAPVLLTAGTLIVVVAPAGPVRPWGWAVVVLALALAVVAGRGHGKTPFRAAIALALLSAGSLVANSWS